jgi:hypothetical protein
MLNVKEELNAYYGITWLKRSRREVEFGELLGKTIVEIAGAEEDSRAIVFLCDDGTKYMMHHEQDCCECVTVNDICGDITRLLNTPITKAEVTDNSGSTEYGHETWTFYHLATVKGYATIRWYGESNGYYSEDVNFVRL